MVYGMQITIVMGIYKPTNITGGPHIVGYFWGSSSVRDIQVTMGFNTNMIIHDLDDLG